VDPGRHLNADVGVEERLYDIVRKAQDDPPTVRSCRKLCAVSP
jgi:hypothetical protein